MKRLIKIFALAITINIVFAIFPEQIQAQQNDVNFQMFYDQLSPYGQWIENSNYGYVWVPTENADFTPYLTNGYWVLTDDGWTWVSNYDWGWATFHYGRWDYNNSYGWFWVPDNEWGPSWVTWRRSNGYYGWAPMRPGVSINISFGGNNNIPNDRWIFVRDRDFERHDIDRNYIDRQNNSTIIINSTIINKTYYDDKRRTTYVTGPGREDVQKNTGRTIKPIHVQERDKPGQRINNNQLQIYRPQIRENIGGRKPAPTKLTNPNDVKRISVRDVQKQPQNMQPLNNRTGNVQQQPSVNFPNKINSKENLHQQRNSNSKNNNINRERQPVVNSLNKIDTRNQANNRRQLDPPLKGNNKNQSSPLRNTNPPKRNNVEQPPKSNLDNNKKENKQP